MAKLVITVAWDEAVAFVRREGRLLFPISFMLIALPQALAEALAPPSGADGSTQPGAWLLALPIAAIISFVGNVAISYLALRPGASVGEALKQGMRRMAVLAGAFLLGTLALIPILFITVTVAVMAVPGAAAAAAAGVQNDAFAKAVLIAMLLMLPLAIYFAVRLMLLTPLAAGESGGPIALMIRSWKLTSGHVWTLAGVLLLVFIAYVVGVTAIHDVVGLAIIRLSGPPAPGSIGAIVMILVSAGLNTLIAPFLATLFTRLYAQLAGPGSVGPSSGI